MDWAPSLEKETFLDQVFSYIASEEERKFPDPLTQLLCSENLEISNRLDQTLLQESWSWRNVHVARELAKALIGEKGELKKTILSKAIQLLKNHLFSLGAHRHHDAFRQQHLLKILQLLEESNALNSALKSISKPIQHRGAEKLIRETLFLNDHETVTDAHARTAALSALLTSLRQNVGSCFATAPAILIQQQQPHKFLTDISQLFGIGSLKRTYEGNEYHAPLSLSWGAGDLLKPIFMTLLGEDPWKTLSNSPGINAAFTAAGAFQGQEDEIPQECEKILKECFRNLNLNEPFLHLDANQIIQKALLHIFGLSEEEVARFQENSFKGFVGDLIIQPHSQRGKSSACKRYLEALDRAKSAFKAVTDNALLKAWEFTLASLSESKADFARWNLSASLGMHPEEPNGIGNLLYTRIQQKIENINGEIEGIQSQYDHIFAQVKSLEGRIQRASTEGEVSWIRAEYQMRRHELEQILQLRDHVYGKGSKLSQLFPFLYTFYGEKFKDYFQEVYDAQMHDVSTNPYDDSPAGFRLLYKHGRANTSLWTLIYTPAEYIQSLSSFFSATEIELSQKPEVEGLQSELTDLITTVLQTIKGPEFLESSFHRLAQAYQEPIIKNPLDHLERIGRKPWAYISGGTMETLVSCYWGNPHKIKEVKQWMESEMELLVFYLDTLKELPYNMQKLFQRDEERSMLAFSPTHAFLLKPGKRIFREGWENKAYTYTWIRDYWIVPQQNFIHSILLDHRMMEYLVDKVLRTLPEGYRALSRQALGKFNYSMRPPEFRQYILGRLSYEKWLQIGNRLQLLGEEIDSILFSSLPLFPEYQLREKLEILFDSLDEVDTSLRKKIFEAFDKIENTLGRYQILSANELRKIAKGLVMLGLKKTRSSIPFHQKITEAMQKTGLSLPMPILFADTNWVKNYFGFVVNPGSEELEFWRLDDCGSEGRPMQIWKRYLDGTDRKDWGIYHAPYEYGQSL